MAGGQRTIKQNIAWNSIGSTVYLALQWLTTVLVVRLSSGYDAAGQLALAMSITNLFTPFAMYKIRAYQVSDIKGEYSSGEYLGFRVITIASSFAGTMVYVIFTCDLENLALILAYIAFKAIDVFIDVLHGIDQRNGRMDYIGQSLMLRGILLITAFCGILYLTNNLLLAVSGMALFTLPVAIFFDWPRAASFGKLKLQIHPTMMKRLALNCLPAVVASFCMSATASIPRQYLQFVGGDAMLGVYASVATPVLIIQMGATYLYSPLMVPFAERFVNGDTTSFVALLRKTSLGILSIGIICTILFFFFGEWAMCLIFGESILPYMYLLQPMIICAISTAYIWFLSDLLIVMREMKGNLVGNAIAFLAALASMVPFIQVFLMNGVSFAQIFANAIGIFVLLGFMAKKLKQFNGRGNR